MFLPNRLGEHRGFVAGNIGGRASCHHSGGGTRIGAGEDRGVLLLHTAIRSRDASAPELCQESYATNATPFRPRYRRERSAGRRRSWIRATQSASPPSALRARHPPSVSLPRGRYGGGRASRRSTAAALSGHRPCVVPGSSSRNARRPARWALCNIEGDICQRSCYNFRRRGSPRGREPGLWIPAYAGMSGTGNPAMPRDGDVPGAWRGTR